MSVDLRTYFFKIISLSCVLSVIFYMVIIALGDIEDSSVQAQEHNASHFVQSGDIILATVGVAIANNMG